MNDDSHHHYRSWLERLNHVLLKEPKDRYQLIELLHDAKERELLDHDALAMIEGVLKVSEIGVNALYIIGKNEEKIRIKDLVRPAVLIPESKRLDILLKEFRLKRYHMAIVSDEYGSVSGLITIEDVLEQIVGSIEEEIDIVDREPNITQLNPKEFTVKALTPIDEFNAHFETNINDEDFDTIGGYVMQQFGHLPKRGESIELDDLKITVILTNKRRLQLLRLTKQTAENE